MRGLKQEYRNTTLARNWVASFVDAWIETKDCARLLKILKVASFVDAWIETKKGGKSEYVITASHPSWMRGLKLKTSGMIYKDALSHPSWMRGLKHQYQVKGHVQGSRILRGCVD